MYQIMIIKKQSHPTGQHYQEMLKSEQMNMKIVKLKLMVKNKL